MFSFNRIAFYNIRAALLVFVLLPFLITIIATGWYGLYRLEVSAKAAMEEEIELLARAIRLPLSHALQHGHSGTLQRSVTSIFDIDKVYAVYVYDKDGKRISTSGSSKARVQDREAVDLANKGDEQGEFDEVGGEEVFSYFLPLTDSGERSIGLLQVTRRGSDFSRRIDEFRVNAIGMLVLSALLVMALIWVGYQRAVGRHIHRMREDMELIAAGELQHRVAVDGPSEIRFLAQGFNQMLDSIVASEQELRERREREYELHTRLQQNEKLAAIGRFAAGVAHELGTPLSVADGKAQRELRRADEQSAGVLHQIRQQLQRMERIIRQLMDFARPVKPVMSDVKVTDLLHSSLAQVDMERQQQDVQMIVAGRGNSLSLQGDRLRLEQALINLLRNAIQATPGGRVRLDWQVTDPGWLVFTVEDDGPGIDEGDQRRLLEPFFTTKSTGTGLGLAVVDAVVSEHGGRIAVGHSEWGGASFRLHLPLNPHNQGADHDQTTAC